MGYMLQGAIRAEIAGIWAYAYMNGKLTRPFRPLSDSPIPADHPTRKRPVILEDAPAGEASALYETALFNRFGIWRTPYGFNK